MEKSYTQLLPLFLEYRISNKNHTLINDCFFQEFSQKPELFETFLVDFEKIFYGLSSEEKQNICKKYLTTLSFLCERLGFFNQKLHWDDIAFSTLYTQEYKNIKQSLEKYQKGSKKIVEKIYKVLETFLKESHIQGKIEGRYKNMYSIYRKTLKYQDRDIFRLNDIFAFRIIVKGDRETCFDILNVLHDTCIPLPDRFKDYISIPKINGYQSLHTGLVGVIKELDLPIEVQIHSAHMHEVAEGGIAAHFLYAKTKKAQMIDEKEKKLLEHLSLQRQKSYIFVLTPQKDIIKILDGAGILDFAEKVHTKLRKQVRSCSVNGKKQSASYIPKMGDIVEIIT